MDGIRQLQVEGRRKVAIGAGWAMKAVAAPSSQRETTNMGRLVLAPWRAAPTSSRAKPTHMGTLRP
ncbi:hypothetical protein ColKHC_03597 [Colletotrichum higginsianum]|nr:hypothetical protein ColKHC_03597 [Colletotrichum higginsianum]